MNRSVAMFSLPGALRALVLALLAAALFLPTGGGDAGAGGVVWVGAGTGAGERPGTGAGAGAFTGTLTGSGGGGPVGAERVNRSRASAGGVDTAGTAGDVDGEAEAALERVLLASGAPGLIVRSARTPPAPVELALLEAAARRSPLVVALPAAAPGLRVAPPAEPRTGRATALPFTLSGAPGDTVLVRLRDDAGPVDSLHVRVAAGGEASAAFRIRPARPGWHAWWVEAGGEVRRTGAWVRDAEPPRVLVAAGPPTWESRFVMRALEEAGAHVTAAQPLGRGLAVGGATAGGAAPDGATSRAADRDARHAGAAGALPASAEALAAYDVVILLPGAHTGPGRLRALARYAGESGGGVLAAGDGGAAAALGVADGWGPAAEISGQEIAWRLPAALAPLPHVPVRSAARTLGALRAGAAAVAGKSAAGVGAPITSSGSPGSDPAGTPPRAGISAESRPFLALRPFGRGRAAALGLRETWRWRMEAGRVIEHRAFWRSLVDWLAAGLRDSLLIELPAPIGPTGEPVEVVVHGVSSDAPPPRLTLARPGGRNEALALAAVPAHPGTYRATFLPDSAGTYTLAFADGAPRTAFHAEPTPAPPTAGWAELALLAHRSGGAALPADSVDAWVARWTAEHTATRPVHAWLRPLLFTLIALVAVTEWTLRRLRGRA